MGCVDLHTALAVHSVHGVGGEGSHQPHLSNATREGHLDCARNLVSESWGRGDVSYFAEGAMAFSITVGLNGRS